MDSHDSKLTLQIYGLTVLLVDTPLSYGGLYQMMLRLRNRSLKRNIIWYNPPYNKSVSTIIGHVFLNLSHRHFHKEHKLNKIFNRNSVKVSHSCTKNIEHINKNHNRKITEIYIEKSVEASCNCKEKTDVH